MPLVALGASKLTGDPTRFKESYTANHPLLPPPVPPPRSTSPFSLASSGLLCLHRGMP